MRARTVDQNKAYVFDFDDTLVKTSAKVHIYKDGRRIYFCSTYNAIWHDYNSIGMEQHLIKELF